MKHEYLIGDLVKVIEEEGSCRIVIECDDRMGAGFALEQINGFMPRAVPDDWLEQLQAQGLS